MPSDDVIPFYDSLADHYHLLFDDWDRAIARQSRLLTPLLGSLTPLHILDFACGIGTQAIAFALAGHHVTGTDLSPAEIARARREAAARALQMDLRVADMTSLTGLPDRHIDVAAAFDNALPHLTAKQLPQAIAAVTAKLKPKAFFSSASATMRASSRNAPASSHPLSSAPAKSLTASSTRSGTGSLQTPTASIST